MASSSGELAQTQTGSITSGSELGMLCMVCGKSEGMFAESVYTTASHARVKSHFVRVVVCAWDGSVMFVATMPKHCQAGRLYDIISAAARADDQTLQAVSNKWSSQWQFRRYKFPSQGDVPEGFELSRPFSLVATREGPSGPGIAESAELRTLQSAGQGVKGLDYKILTCMWPEDHKSLESSAFKDKSGEFNKEFVTLLVCQRCKALKAEQYAWQETRQARWESQAFAESAAAKEQLELQDTMRASELVFPCDSEAELQMAIEASMQPHLGASDDDALLAVIERSLLDPCSTPAPSGVEDAD